MFVELQHCFKVKLVWVLVITGCMGGAPYASAAPQVVAARVVSESPLRVSMVQQGGHGVRLNLDGEAYLRIKDSDAVTLTQFPLSANRSVDLELRRVEVFTPDAQLVAGSLAGDAPLARPNVAILHGSVKNEPGSSVYLALSPLGSNGWIDVGGERFIVAHTRTPNHSESVVYNLTTLPAGAINSLDWTCTVEQVPVRAGAVAPRGVERFIPVGQTAQAAAARKAVMAIDTDWELTANRFGGDVAATNVYIATLVGAASEIYQREVDTILQIGYLRIWEDAGDPWDKENTSDQLVQFRSYWNANMGGVERHVVHMLSGRGLGGGIAYLPGLCSSGWDYAVSANLNGSFPYPLVDNAAQNWDIMVFSHELGHNFNAPHTHNMTPRIDNCAGGDCSVTPNGTIMSYCHLCPGGLSNIQLRFHDRIKDERILPYITTGVSCDLSVGPTDCTAASRPTAGTLGEKNRYVSIVPGNPGQQTALRFEVISTPTGYEYLDGQTLWVTEPQEMSENSGVLDPGDAPGFPSYWSATLTCNEGAAFVTDWSTYGTVHVYDETIFPGVLYGVQAVDNSCDFAVESNFSIPLGISTSRFGDLVLNCQTFPCGPANGSVDIVSDAIAVLRKFTNEPGAPIKARTDLQPSLLDGKVGIADVLQVILGFQGLPYNLPDPVPCP